MSDNQEREEAHTGDVCSDHGSTATRQEHRTCLYAKFPFLEEDQSERAEEVADRALGQNIQDYPDKVFGSFVWAVAESKNLDTSLKASSFFGFVVTWWTKVGTPSLNQNLVGLGSVFRLWSTQ